MCGICGAIGFDDKEIIVRMNRSLVHRGPDDEGVWGEGIRREEPMVGLGHRRLSIIDLSPSGHQPMANEDGAIRITYNGEIYNFQTLRSELLTKGHRFKSKTDTEAIIHLYEEYGEGCLKYLRGMFAFALWDKRKEKLFAARDRFGIKPFFYYFKDGKFIFASELRAMLTLGAIKKDLNLDAAADYFTYGSVSAPDTMIKDIFQLLPAHYLVLENGRLKIERYWEIDCSKAVNSRKTDTEHISDISVVLDEAVRIRMLSDVPLGAFLSGGIDSSTIVALMQKHSTQPIKTFSVVFKEKRYDEREFSNKIADKFGTDHREILLGEEDVLREMPSIFDAMDQPSADGFNTYVISRMVREAGLTVALSGLGGDEIFAGYPSFKMLPKIARMLNCTKYILGKQRLYSILSRGMKSRRGLKVIASLLKCKSIYDLYRLQRMIFLPEEVNKILRLLRRPDLRSGLLAMTGEESSHIPRNDDVNTLSYLELTTYLRNTLLQDTDRMSMANSLEVRVPFLDHLLIEKMFEIPGRLKEGNDFPKRLLVKSIKGLLPDEVINRPKMGFVFPFDYWLKDKLKDYCQDRFSEVSLKNIPVINVNRVNKIWADFLNGSKLHNYSSILTLLSFVNWYKKNIQG